MPPHLQTTSPSLRCPREWDVVTQRGTHVQAAAVPKRLCAFTLIELLTAMSIILVIMTITVVSWMEVRRGYEIRQGLSQIHSTLSLARQMAIFKQNRMGVYFPTTITNRCYVVSNLTLKCIVGEGGTNILPKGVEFTAFPPQGIIFGSDGYLVQGSGIVKISEFKPSGSVRMLRYAEITVNKVGLLKTKTGIQ